jgi:DNA repair photolyase
MSIRYEHKDFKSILNTFKFIDNWFWCRYGINPYQGCEHACTYCDSRSHKYHLHPEFDQVVIVKNNVREMLDKRLSRARTLLPDVVVMSGASDPYHPAESEFGNTRKCLEVLTKHRYPVHIITKSNLVTKDIDLLSRIAEDNWCSVSVTITTTNKKLSGFLEPLAPLPSVRFDTIKQLKKSRNVQVGVTFMPIIPFLGDDTDHLEDVVKLAKESGADYILFAGGMTMRDAQASWFMKRLDEKFPELVDKYLELYDARMEDGVYIGKYTPSKTYLKRINKIMFELCDKYKINSRMKRFIPDDYRKENYIIAEEFLNEAYYMQSLSKPWSNMFWAGQNINNLKEPIRSVAAKGELKKIRNVDAEFDSEIQKRLKEM